jgi:hypothetical protein
MHTRFASVCTAVSMVLQYFMDMLGNSACWFLLYSLNADVMTAMNAEADGCSR